MRTTREEDATAKRGSRLESHAGAVFFIAFIAADFLWGGKAAVRVLGIACVFAGLLWMLRRAVPVGIEGKPPSFLLGGWAAPLAGMAMLAVGIAMLAYASIAVCLLGWGAAADCP